MKILIIDNYDSFTYNLVYILRQNTKVSHLSIVRNDKITAEEVKKYDKVLLSPGPGIPAEAGMMPDLLSEYGSQKSILGVCLGHQGMAETFGCELENMSQVLHGFQDDINLNEDDYLFKGLGNRITCGRYHSWRIKKSSLGGPLEVIATDDEGEIMGIRHQQYDLRGLQFHPESIMTSKGKEIMDNWVSQ